MLFPNTKAISVLQLLKKEIDEMKEQELELRQQIIGAAQRGAQETADQFRGTPVDASSLSAPDLQQELEIVQGARLFAQGLVVSYLPPYSFGMYIVNE